MNRHTKACLDPAADVWGIEEAEGGGGGAAVPGGVAAAGAYKRLRLFAQHAAETSWAGDNAANIQGEMKSGDGEPYLADMVVVPASLIHGILGIQPTWERLEVKPCLPAGWPRAEADVLYKGRRHRVTIEAGNARVQPLDQVISIPKP